MRPSRSLFLFLCLILLYTPIYGIDSSIQTNINIYNNDYVTHEPFVNDFLKQPQDGTVVVYGNNGNGNGNGNGNDKELKDALKAWDKWKKAGNSGTFEYFLTNVYYNTPIGDYWIILLVFVLMYIIYIINKKPKQNK